MSGIFRSGRPFGYLLATACWKVLDGNPHGWRALFWFGAGPPVLLVVSRLLMDETNTFHERLPHRAAKPDMHGAWAEVRFALARHWAKLLYLSVFMIGFSFMVRACFPSRYSPSQCKLQSHGTHDLYPLMVRNKYNFSTTEMRGC